MGSQVFYRKWRPQTLAELAGQEHVAQTLRNALEKGRVAHAYLFCGPRGTGKTSTGRILAKAVNCLNNGKGEPCNICTMCQAISQGHALDVIEIDAASNRGIDEIRQLRERVNFSPNIARYKVYIIDEVHMLTEAASNALLKTLEEPPPHALFFLATTEPHKLLPTILSRCQRFDFRRISPAAIVKRLSYICQKEGIEFDPLALNLLAKSASGSLRDAENLLEQLVAYYGSSVSLRQVQEMLGITADRRAEQLARQIARKDLAAGLATLNSVVNDGLDLPQFTRELVEYLRSLLLVKSGAPDSLNLNAEEIANRQELVQQFSLAEIVQAIKLFGQIDFRFQDYSPLPLELALAQCTLPPAEKREEIPAIPTEPAPVHQAAVAPKAKEEVQATAPAQSASSTLAEKELAPSPTQIFSSELERIRGQWDDFVNTLKGIGTGGKLDAYFRGVSEPVSIEENTLVVGFYYDFHKGQVEKRYTYAVEEKLAEKFGTPYKVRFVLKPKATPRALDGHMVKAAQEMGGIVISVEEK